MNAKPHTEFLGTMGVGRLVARFAIPSSITFIVASTYNLVDAIFVGRGVGPAALGAITLVMPFQTIIAAFGSLLATGSSSIVSRAFGAGEGLRARKTAGTAFITALFLGIIILVCGKVLVEPILSVLAASGELHQPTREYLGLILFIEPILLFNFCANGLIRTEGRAKLATATMILGMLVNIGLDPLFILGFGWGVKGAALATICGHTATFLFIAGYFVSKKSSLKIGLADLLPDFSVLWQTVAIGSSGFVRQASANTVNIIRNSMLVLIGGEILVSAFGAAIRTILFLGLPAMGIAQALPPIAGYNYGAGKYDRVKRALWVSVIACTAFTAVSFIVTQAVPRHLLSLFSSDQELIRQGVIIMRIIAFVFLGYPAYFIAPSFFQALGKPVNALLLSLIRPVLSLAVILVGARMKSSIGILAADPIAIAAAAVVALLFLRRGVMTMVESPEKSK